MANVIFLRNISKIYTSSLQKRVVEGVNLEIAEGEFFCLVGPSGCGKSTLLKLIAGLESPTSGEINRPENIGIVFQSGALFPWLTVEDNIAFGLRMKNTPKETVRETVDKYLQMVGLSDFKKRYPAQLSGGQKQRVGIARALATDPQVLLLDEPFSALDPLTTDQLHADLLKIWRETGKTILMVSHSLPEAVLLSDRIGVMVDGKIKGIVEVDLPRPRHNEQENFIPLINKTKKLFGE